MTFDCRNSPALRRRAGTVAVALATVMLVGVAALGAAPQQHETPAAQHDAARTETERAPHEQTILQTAAKLANFAILAGVLVYFLRTPISGYLSSRGIQIRQDLVKAAEMRAAASAQLAEIERKLKTLPAELEALKARGAEDVLAEKARIAEAAAAERERLIEQTRREIDMRLRLVRRELTEYAAALAIRIAEDRIRRSITLDDQMRMLDRYTAQLKEAR